MVYIGTMENLRVEQITAEQGEFPHADDPSGENVYFACSLGEKVFCYVQIIIVQIGNDLSAFFHLTHKCFSPGIFKAMRMALQHYFRVYLKELGVRDFVGMARVRTKNWSRLMNLLGFDVYQLPDGRLFIREEV
jgi:hypothetical protein